MKNMAIALHAGTAEKRNSITNYLSTKGYAVWHWSDDFWIVQVPDTYTPKSFYASLEQLAHIGSSTVLVFQFQGRISYWGRHAKQAWAWLSKIGRAE